MAQQVFPTKSNLMATRRSLALASQGYELMDRKRNILVREMMRLIDRAAAIQDKISAAYAEAYAALQRANITLGSVGEFTASVPVEHGLQVARRSVMGVELPYVSVKSEEPKGPPYGLSLTSGELDDAYFKFREVRDLIRDLAETENSIYRLAYAIKKAQKRANALKNIVIPGLDAEIFRITDALEEKEREEFVRLKVVKGRNERLKEESEDSQVAST